MKLYVWLTFGFMGWAYYEMSGGADFEPVERQVAEVDPVAPEAPEVVTRSEPTLLSLSTSNVTAPPQAVEVEAPEVPTPVSLIQEAAPEPVEPKIDLRSVAGSRVNMRMGPGTDFEVITTLNGGTKLEVIDVNPDGWANVRTTDLGIEGWMAERLLSDPQL